MDKLIEKLLNELMQALIRWVEEKLKPGPVPPPEPPPTPVPPTDVLGSLVAAHNEIRRQNSLPALIVDPRLMQAAGNHALDQAQHNRMDHTGSDGSSAGQRITRSGYNWNSYGENVAAGYATVSAVMSGWLRSAGHRRNLLGNWKHIGVGVATSSSGKKYWCVDFAR